MDSRAIPEAFRLALLGLREASGRTDVEFEEVPPPRGLAPLTAALAMRTLAEEFGEPAATGRFVVLHDPGGQPGWNGYFRIVAQIRSHIDPEMGTDPLLAEALWGWADECLFQAGAGYHDLAGTVTRELSEAFGGLELKGSTLNVEIRASWTPSPPDLAPHLSAWTDLMTRTAGVAASRFLEGV